MYACIYIQLFILNSSQQTDKMNRQGARTKTGPVLDYERDIQTDISLTSTLLSSLKAQEM